MDTNEHLFLDELNDLRKTSTERKLRLQILSKEFEEYYEKYQKLVNKREELMIILLEMDRQIANVQYTIASCNQRRGSVLNSVRDYDVNITQLQRSEEQVDRLSRILLSLPSSEFESACKGEYDTIFQRITSNFSVQLILKEIEEISIRILPYLELILKHYLSHNVLTKKSRPLNNTITSDVSVKSHALKKSLWNPSKNDLSSSIDLTKFNSCSFQGYTSNSLNQKAVYFRSSHSNEESRYETKTQDNDVLGSNSFIEITSAYDNVKPYSASISRFLQVPPSNDTSGILSRKGLLHELINVIYQSPISCEVVIINMIYSILENSSVSKETYNLILRIKKDYQHN